MTPALNAEQQSQILRRAKNMIQARERAKTMAKSSPVSAKRHAALLKEQEDRFSDFLKEL